jgi:hypothetical protein
MLVANSAAKAIAHYDIQAPSAATTKLKKIPR